MLASNKETTIIALINYYFRINESSELTLKGPKRTSTFLFWEWESMSILTCDGIQISSESPPVYAVRMVGLLQVVRRFLPRSVTKWSFIWASVIKTYSERRPSSFCLRPSRRSEFSPFWAGRCFRLQWRNYRRTGASLWEVIEITQNICPRCIFISL